jgi:hypothetical protein
MEGGMPDRDIRDQHYPTVEFVLDAIAGWINKYRHIVRDELGECSQEDVMRIAKDLGVPVSDLLGLATKGARSADVLQKMLLALSVDPKALAKNDPAVMRDLQRLCIVCSQKGRCQHELAQGTAAEHFHEFCPNAYTLDALFQTESTAFQALMQPPEG